MSLMVAIEVATAVDAGAIHGQNEPTNRPNLKNLHASENNGRKAAGLLISKLKIQFLSALTNKNNFKN